MITISIAHLVALYTILTILSIPMIALGVFFYKMKRKQKVALANPDDGEASTDENDAFINFFKTDNHEKESHSSQENQG